MKKKIYAIGLLLSFMIVLGHEMIPHHHGYNFDIQDVATPQPKHHSHHHSDGHHHHHKTTEQDKADNSRKNHDHPFPLHHHLSTDYGFDCIRIDLRKNVELQSILLMVLTTRLTDTEILPPEIEFLKYFANKPFRIKSIFEPGAIGLRAPPSIA